MPSNPLATVTENDGPNPGSALVSQINKASANKSTFFNDNQVLVMPGPQSENQKSGEVSEGLPAENVHERTSE